MKKRYPELAHLPMGNEAATLSQLQQTLQADLDALSEHLIQDLSHISHFANYSDGLQIDAITHVKDNLYILHYRYNWQINYSCADQMETGTVTEKLRFTLTPDGEITFKFLTLDR